MSPKFVELFASIGISRVPWRTRRQPKAVCLGEDSRGHPGKRREVLYANFELTTLAFMRLQGWVVRTSEVGLTLHRHKVDRLFIRYDSK